MKNNYLLGAVAALSAITLVSSPVKAETIDNSGTGDIPVNISIAPTPINVMAPQSIDLTVAANTNDAVIGTDYRVENKANSGVIVVDSFKTTALGSWELVDKSTDFANLQAGAEKLYLGAKFGSDADYVDMKDTYKPKDNEINASSSKGILFEGKTGSVKNEVNNENIATVTITLHQKEYSNQPSGIVKQMIMTGPDTYEELELDLSKEVQPSDIHFDECDEWGNEKSVNDGETKCQAHYAITKPSFAYLNFYGLNSEQKPGPLPLPTPYIENYSILLSNDITNWVDEGKPNFDKTSGGDFEYQTLTITQEDIDNAGGVYYLHIAVRSNRFPSFPIGDGILGSEKDENGEYSDLGQAWHLSYGVYEL